ncbi:MAG: tripartite tricarboxylate transporter substrate binding protein [Betaproteobacteria bacterium]|nr:tripartite tricarboxylate transporter substrate binding protein [Betaproteobacteria bacterium]
MPPTLPPRLASLAAALLLAGSALAQSYATKPVRIVVPYPPGGAGDLSTRAFAERFSAKIGQSVIVENMPGASQIIGGQAVAKAAPDGYTMVLASPTSMVLNPALRKSLPYAPERMTLISKLFTAPLFVIVSGKLPVNTLPELVAYMKARPGELNYGSIGEGSATHLATALFAQLTGTQMKHIPYKGSAGINPDLMSGVLQMHFDPGAGTLALVRDGRLKALAVTGAKRSPTLPNVPTAIEAGVAGYEVVSWWGLAAPEGVPPALAKQIAAAVAQALTDPALKDVALKFNIEYEATTPEQFTAFVQAEKQRWGQVIQTLGLKPE